MHLYFRIATSCLLLNPLAFAYGNVPSSSKTLEAVRADLMSGRADHGLESLDQILTQQPQNAEAHNLRCRIYMQEKHWDEAITSCKTAVKLEPSNSEYHLWLARALGEKADRVSFITAYKMAKQIHQEFETAASLDPHNVGALSDLGEFYVDAPGIVGGGTDKAEKLSQQLEAISPEKAHYIRARIADDQKNFTQAEQEFKAAIASAKDPSSAWMDLASFYRRRQRWDDMIQAVHAGADANTKHDAALVDGASTLIRANRDLPYARQLLEEYLASPNRSEDAPAFGVQVQLGKLLTKLGDEQSAQQQFAAAQELAKDYQVGTHGATNTGR